MFTVLRRIWMAAQLALQKTLDDAAEAAAKRAQARAAATTSAAGAAGVYQMALNKGPVAWMRDHVLIVMWAPVALSAALIGGVGGVLGWGWAVRFGGWVRDSADKVLRNAGTLGSLVVIGAVAYVLFQIMERGE